MTVDIQESLLTSIYTLLTTDDTLKAAMGGTVRLYPVWATPDAEMPYLVHRLDLTHPDWSPVPLGTYLLDIWTDSPSIESALDIRKAVVDLLDGLESSTDETSEYWMWLQTDGFVPESAEGINHYATQWRLKFVKDAMIGELIKR